MRKLITMLVFAIGAWPALFAAEPVAKIQLPCESRFQMLSPAGTQIAVYCKDHTLRLVSVPEGKEGQVFPAEHRANTNVYSLDGRWLGFGFDDGKVTVSPSTSAGPSKTIATGTRRVDLLYFLPDGKKLLVAPLDSAGQVWELGEAPQRVATLPVDFGGITAAAASPDGKLLVTASDDTVVRWYDTTSWQKLREYRGFLLEPFAVVFTADGKQVLAAGADSRITVLDAATAKQVAELPAEAGSYISGLMMLDQNRVAAVYLDTNGEKPPHGLIWDLASGKSMPVSSNAQPTCGESVKGKLWLCTVEGTTLSIWKQ
jgi:WD40 repeat protein